MTQDSEQSHYPWYSRIEGNELQQGDILSSCPIIELPDTVVDADTKDPVTVSVFTQDAVILTQSCDLALRSNGKCKVDAIILCPILSRESLKADSFYGKSENWEAARKGSHPRYHVLNSCKIAGLETDYSLVDLSNAFSLNEGLVRTMAGLQNPRPRLNPPYREHLSQAFARFFMRVGLPVDIPKFTK
jgi:hypothetical protein